MQQLRSRLPGRVLNGGRQAGFGLFNLVVAVGAGIVGVGIGMKDAVVNAFPPGAFDGIKNMAVSAVASLTSGDEDDVQVPNVTPNPSLEATTTREDHE